MKMMVGLGNPGQKYVGTRHNIGFDVIGEVAKRHVAPLPRAKFESEYTEIQIGQEKVILLCPLTYMNLSGNGVSQAAGFFKIKPSDIIVVCDDFNLNLERIRFRPAGSAGGQNGLDDIIKKLGTQGFPRLRVGIGPVPEKWNPADFVLGKFSSEEINQLKPVVDRCVRGLEEWVKSGIQHCMTQYNGLPQKEKPDKGKSRRPSLTDSDGPGNGQGRVNQVEGEQGGSAD